MRTRLFPQLSDTSRRVPLLALVSTLCFAVPAAIRGQADPAPEAIDALFAEWDTDSSPGCALGVYRDGEIVYQNAYGMANLDWGIPIEPSTVFYVGSVSKQFTAASIALLVRAGTISLDDDIRTFIPELPEYDTPVKIGQLVHHTGGMRDMYASMVASGKDIFDPIGSEEAIDVLADQPLDFPAGQRFSYSNGGYFLLSQIVERASGMTFTEFTTQNIFEPLGMTNTHFHSDPGHVVHRRAMSYQADESGMIKQNYVSTFAFVGQGGLYTTVGDLIKWDRNFYEGRVGGEGFAGMLETPGTLTDGSTIDYAFGLRHEVYRGQKAVGHSGGMMGFRADLIRFPDQHFTVSALCNQSQINPGVLTRRVADMYLADVLVSR